MCETSYVNVQNDFVETNYWETEWRKKNIPNVKITRNCLVYWIRYWILNSCTSIINIPKCCFCFAFSFFASRSHTQNKISCCFSFRFVYNWTIVLLEFFNCTQIVFLYVDRHIWSSRFGKFRLQRSSKSIALIGKWLWIIWNILKWKIETIFLSIFKFLITIWMVLIHSMMKT